MPRGKTVEPSPARAQEAMALDMAAALDPGVLATRVGLEPRSWQVDALRLLHRPRLCWVVARQCGKSTAVALLAVWTAVYRPGSTILLISKSQTQADELLERARQIYRVVGAEVPLRSEQVSRMETEAGSRIISLPGASEASIRGWSADLLVLDEASRIEDETYTAARATVAATRGRVVLLSTPFDRTGFFYRAAVGDDPGWDVIKVPAEGILDPAFLAQERSSMTPVDYAREYEVDFSGATGMVWTESQWDELKQAGLPTLARLG